MKRIKNIYILAVIFLMLSPPAFAQQQCYSPTEMQAEQLLRLHSELMVITVTCKEGSSGQDLVSAYTGFTKKYIATLHDAEQTMIHYYQARFGGNGIARLDKLRTILGNEYGQAIADVSAPVFCQQRRDKVSAFFVSTPKQIDNEVHHMVLTERSYAKPCAMAANDVTETIPTVDVALNIKPDLIADTMSDAAPASRPDMDNQAQ